MQETLAADTQAPKPLLYRFCAKHLNMNLTKTLGRREWSGLHCENLLYAAAKAPTRAKFSEAMTGIRSYNRGTYLLSATHCTRRAALDGTLTALRLTDFFCLH